MDYLLSSLVGHGDRSIVPAKKKKRDKVIRIDKEAKEERNCDGTVVIILYRKKNKKMKKYALF